MKNCLVILMMSTYRRIDYQTKMLVIFESPCCLRSAKIIDFEISRHQRKKQAYPT